MGETTAQPHALAPIPTCLVDVEAVISVSAVGEVGTLLAGVEVGAAVPSWAKGEIPALLLIGRFQLLFDPFLSDQRPGNNLLVRFDPFLWIFISSVEGILSTVQQLFDVLYIWFRIFCLLCAFLFCGDSGTFDCFFSSSLECYFNQRIFNRLLLSFCFYFVWEWGSRPLCVDVLADHPFEGIEFAEHARLLDGFADLSNDGFDLSLVVEGSRDVFVGVDVPEWNALLVEDF
jgi:hypothetical protein